LNVVYLSPSGRLGGAEVALLNIFAALKAARPDWELHLIVSADGPLVLSARALGVNSTVLSFPPPLARIGDASTGGPAGRQIGRSLLLARLLLAGPGIARYRTSLRRILGNLDAQLIHANGFKMHVLSALAKPPATPLIWHIHDYLSCRPLMARLIKRLQGSCSLVLANSNSVQRDIERVCGHSLPVRTLYNAVDTNVFSPQGPIVDLDQLSGLPAVETGVVRVGLLATLARWKGHETFLQALAMVPRELPVRGYIIGDALYETDGSQYSLGELKDMARRLGVSDRVGFTGFVAEPAAAMRALDVVVHASTTEEPFGLVIVEGMACGRAVVTSAGGGAAELIKPEITALVHTPGDAAQLAACLTRLAKDAGLRARLGAAGRASVEEHFEQKRLGAELISIYEELIANKPN
jgi:glycosyltransferase involved in cell wall biosynthesis